MEEVGMELHLVFVSLLFLKTELVFHLQFVMLSVPPLDRSLEKIQHPESHAEVQDQRRRTFPQRRPYRNGKPGRVFAPYSVAVGPVHGKHVFPVLEIQICGGTVPAVRIMPHVVGAFQSEPVPVHFRMLVVQCGEPEGKAVAVVWQDNLLHMAQRLFHYRLSFQGISRKNFLSVDFQFGQYGSRRYAVPADSERIEYVESVRTPEYQSPVMEFSGCPDLEYIALQPVILQKCLHITIFRVKTDETPAAAYPEYAVRVFLDGLEFIRHKGAVPAVVMEEFQF